MITNSPQQTLKIAALLVKTIAKNPKASPRVFALKGELGAGKTTFIQGVARALKIKNKVLSPTFVIMKDFPLSKKFAFKRFYHIDCYRIEKPEEILALGFKNIIKNPQNLIFIEWPERIKKIIPRNALWVEFKIKGKNKRGIKVKNK